MIITKTDILEMAKALVHICDYECCNYGENHALDIADRITDNPFNFEIVKEEEKNEK